MSPVVRELLTSDFGILSMLTIGFIVVMAGYLGWFVHKHVLAEEKVHDDELPRPSR
ncbi:DUF3149 domain-containing protein [Parachitinimonas caeni]|uniref:DUF3149 domain-containing protein n=1 Tax=Parachitinimonas caeni TaxID=3031301 RepID=A0ABT7DSE6_9NEIS|nr:DUF3149 domain-containing protein [Parachitinimonas caeni]MDK2122987.1 DUF3149 domain-containing protein [Parachitinimonas caeni]